MRKRTLMALLTKVGTPQSPVVELSYDGDGLLITIEDQGVRATKAYPEEVLEILDEVIAGTAPHGYLPRLVAPPPPKPEPKPALVGRWAKAPPAPKPRTSSGARVPYHKLTPCQQDAADFMKKYLRHGPVPCSSLYELATAYDISRSTIARAGESSGLFKSERRIDEKGQPREWQMVWLGDGESPPPAPVRVVAPEPPPKPTPIRQCPCSIEKGVRCPNPVQKGRRRCTKHIGSSTHLHLTRRQKVVLTELEEGRRPRRRNALSRTLSGLEEKGLVAPSDDRQSFVLTPWGRDIVQGLRGIK